MTDMDKAIYLFLSDLASKVHNAVKAMDAFISESRTYSPIQVDGRIGL